MSLTIYRHTIVFLRNCYNVRYTTCTYGYGADIEAQKLQATGWYQCVS